MTINSIKNSFRKIENCINSRQLHEAFTLLQIQISANLLGEHQIQLDNLRMTYDNILKFTMTGSSDPERSKVYSKLLISSLELTAKVKQHIIQSSGYFPIYRQKQAYQVKNNLTKEEASKLIDLLSAEIELDDLLLNSSVESQQKDNTTLQDVFNRLWLTDTYSVTEEHFVRELMKSEYFPWYNKGLLVSAITLGLLNIFDISKINLLAEIYKGGQEAVSQRALVGFVLALFKYDKQLILYPDLQKQLKKLAKTENFNDDLELILLQLIKSKDTEKLSKKLQEEILPEVMKMAPKLSDKLDIENMLSEAADEDKNPDWQEFFKDTPKLYQKIEEFSNLQLDGSDVFMSTFAMLKRFPFFNQFTNWLLPFYLEQDSIKSIFQQGDSADLKKEFLEAITFAPYMCNSDKYSFCLNFQHIPEAQQGMMMDMFIAEIRQISELAKEDEALNKSAQIRSMCTQYIQDLYRLFKLHPQKEQLFDIFSEELNYSNTWFSSLLTDNETIDRTLGEFYFQKGYYPQALEVFNKLEKQQHTDLELFQKIAYCYQQDQDYKTALSYYEKADLVAPNNIWNLKKLAYCNRHLAIHEKALGYYLDALKQEAESLFILANIGHSYLDLKVYDKALEYYFKVEYLAPNKHKVVRPIAWISFVLGKYEDATTYYQKIPEDELTKYDLINVGHLNWCLGNRQQASSYYLRSIKEKEFDVKLFEQIFIDDQLLLSEHGIDAEEFPLMLDYIKGQFLN